jgi:hypothetical protein
MIAIINKALRFFRTGVIVTTQEKLLLMANRLAISNKTLGDAVAAACVDFKTPQEIEMENQTLLQLEAQVKQTVEVQKSAVVLITGLSDRISVAVAKALEGGATAEQLAPITQEIADMKASTDALSAAVAAVPA